MLNVIPICRYIEEKYYLCNYYKCRYKANNKHLTITI